MKGGCKMILAIVNKGREVSPHFGHSDGCTIYYIENQQITAEKYIENPLKKPEGGLFFVHGGTHEHSGCSCRSFAVHLMNEIKMDVLVTGHIGGKASQLLSQQGITVIAGIMGKIDDYLHEYVAKAG